MKVRRSCQLVGGKPLLLRKFIHVATLVAIAAIVVGAAALAATATSSALVSSTTETDTSTEATTATVVTTTDQQEAALLEQCNRSAVKYRSKTWYWQHLMGRHKTSSSYKPAQPHTLANCQWVLKLWQRRAMHWQSVARRWMHQRILEYRRNVKLWRLVMGRSTHGRALATGGSLVKQFRHWRQIEVATYRKLTNPPPSLSDWMCIHSGVKAGRWSRSLKYRGGGYKVSNGEGSWTDHGAPYWGGLQMDYNFQRAYGGWLLSHKGTADNWTAYEQIWTAVKAYRSRGFEPWPLTAQACGL